MNNDKTYGVRISLNLGNAITLELKGAGRAHIKPNKEYFFENAPIEFINYLAQLKTLGLTYKITTNKKGCFNTYDLKNYNTLPRIDVLKNFRAVSTLQETKPVEIEQPKEQTVSKEDITKVEPVKVEEPTQEVTNEPIEDEPTVPEVTDEPIVISNDAIIPEEQAQELTDDEVIDTKASTVYTEDDLNSMSKKELLLVAESLGLEVSDINTKKEIKAAIMEVL